ncbi:MAG: hypothetical protein HYY45_18935, partial [Deltaproteobacteria bacterium]|nr:hypothetical protein [Deltaproteobacteria bacterium]
RKSDDLDFFSRNRFNPSVLQAKLESPFKFRYPYHLVKSLVYFAEAEKEPVPRLLLPLSWRDVKQFFETEVGKLNLNRL